MHTKYFIYQILSRRDPPTVSLYFHVNSSYNCINQVSWKSALFFLSIHKFIDIKACYRLQHTTHKNRSEINAKQRSLCLINTHDIITVSLAKEGKDLTHCHHILWIPLVNATYFNNYMTHKRVGSGYFGQNTIRNLSKP